MVALAFATSTIIAVAISALLGAILGYTNITFMTIGMTLVTLSALLSANVRRMGLEAVLEDVGDADETLAAQAVAA